MEQLIRKFIHRSSTYGFISLAVMVLTLAYYRLYTFTIILEKYPELNNFSLFHYLSLSAGNDALLVALIVILVIVTTLLSPANHRRLSAVILVPVTLFHVFGVHFFLTYETAFQKSYIGSEHFTGMGDMASSLMAEVTPGLVLTALLVTLATAGMILVAPGLPVNRKRFRTSAALSIPVTLLIMLLIWTPASRSTQWFPRLNPKVVLNYMEEFSRNPVLSLVSFSSNNQRNTIESDLFPGGIPKRLPTVSLDRKDIIHPKIKKLHGLNKPNIMIYLFESTATPYLDIKIKGKSITPWLNAYKDKGFYFPNHYANYPLSANALFSLLTSTYEMCSKKTVIEHHPRIKRKTLSAILKQHGYRTMLIHTGGLQYARQDRYLEDKGFDRILQYKDLKRIKPYNTKLGWGLDERVMLRPIREFINEDPSRPWFIVVMPINPHHPYVVPHESFMVAGKVTKSLLSDDMQLKLGLKRAEEAALDNLIDGIQSTGDHAQTGPGYKPATENKNNETPGTDEGKTNVAVKRKPRLNPHGLSGKEIWIKYLNSLHYADHSMGYIINGLEKKNKLSKSLVFILADHGEAFYQHRRNYNHPFFLYEENVHVPFMIYSPDYIKKPMVYTGVSRHIDIMPTILDITGYRLNTIPEGISLVSRHRQQYAFLHTSWKYDFLGIRDGKWKYIIRTKDGMEELYNLTVDPGEKKNLARKFPTIINTYRSEIRKGRQYKLLYYKKLLQERTSMP